MLALIINPNNKNIHCENIINFNNEYIKKIVCEGIPKSYGDSISWARFKDDEIFHVISEMKDLKIDNEGMIDDCLYEWANKNIFTQGLNIAIHDSGIASKAKKFIFGNHVYSFYGNAIITGADRNWEDVDCPFSIESIRKMITWCEE